MSRFKSSLNIGKQGERFARKTLEDMGIVTKESNIKDIDFYFEYEGKKYSSECKFDIYANKSSRICVEIYNTKLCKPSGIMRTTADFWFTVLSEHNIFFCTVFSLRRFIKDIKPTKELVGVGDQNSHILLYDMSEICGTCLLELNEGNMFKVIEEINK